MRHFGNTYLLSSWELDEMLDEWYAGLFLGQVQ